MFCVGREVIQAEFYNVLTQKIFTQEIIVQSFFLPNHQTLFLNDDDNIKNYYSIRPENSYPLTAFRRNRVTPYLIFDIIHIVYALTIFIDV